MAGVAFKDGTLVADRGPNVPDEFAIRLSGILDELDVDHVFVSGYVAVLTGRSRATEDIDVLLERAGADRIDRLVHRYDR